MLQDVLHDAESRIPLLPPAVRIPLHAEPAGFARSAWMDFDDPAELLYIFQTVDYWGAGGWLRWHSPLLALLAAALALAFLLWRSRRIWQQPRRRGRVYCRRCNYDLTPVDSSSAGAARCPECGCDLARRPPVRGRRFAWRVALPVAAAAVVGAACAVVMSSTLTLHPMGTPWDAPWPVPLVGRLGPLSNLARIAGSGSESTRVSVHALPTGERLRRFVKQGLSGNHDSRLTPCGRWIVAIREHGHPASPKGEWLEVIDPRTGASRAIVMDGPSLYPRIVGFSPDGTRAYVHWQLAEVLPRPWSLARLDELEIATGRIRRIAEIELAWVLDRRGERHEPPINSFAVDCEASAEGSPPWCLLVFKGRSAGGGFLIEVVRPGDPGRRSFPLELPGGSLHLPRLTQAGRVLEVIDYGARTMIRIDLERQEYSQDPLAPFAWAAVPPSRPGPYHVHDAAAAEEYEVRSPTGGLLARLQAPSGRPGVPLVWSQGKWAALMVYEQEPTLWSKMELCRQRQKYALWIWDLRSLVD